MDRQGTTVQEAAMARRLGQTIEDTHKLAGQAVSLLGDVLQPSEAENTTLTGIERLLEAIVSRLESLDARLSSMESRLPVPPAPSRG